MISWCISASGNCFPFSSGNRKKICQNVKIERMCLLVSTNGEKTRETEDCAATATSRVPECQTMAEDVHIVYAQFRVSVHTSCCVTSFPCLCKGTLCRGAYFGSRPRYTPQKWLAMPKASTKVVYDASFGTV